MPAVMLVSAMLGTILLFTAGLGKAGTVLKAEVLHTEGRYTVEFEVRINAEDRIARRFLTDFGNYSRLSDAITESTVLGIGADGTRRVRIMLHACVMFVCKTVKKVADITILRDGEIDSVTDPAESDFRSAHERWQILPAGRSTLLRYEAELVPSFYIPPLIGPWLVKHEIREELIATSRRIEELADHEARRVQ